MLLFYMLNEVNQVLKYTCVSNQVLARRVLKFMFYPLEALIYTEKGLVGSGPVYRSLSTKRLGPNATGSLAQVPFTTLPFMLPSSQHHFLQG